MNSITVLALQHIVNIDFERKLNSTAHLLPIRGGKIVDLTNGTIRERVKEDIFTFECSIGLDLDIANKNMHLVHKFISDLMLDDQEKIDLLQMILGYSITGDMSKKMFFIFWGGNGNNGKSTLLLILEKILGPFYRTVNKQVFFDHRQGSAGSANPYVADLVHRRMIALSEISPDSDERLNEGLIKALTGGDSQNTRGIYQSSFVFNPYMKPFLICNELPKCSMDASFWDRLVLIPFEAIFTSEPDPTNKQHRLKNDDMSKLISDEGFQMAALYWMIQGSVKFYQGKFVLPQRVKTDIKEYKDSQDLIQQFITDCCESQLSVRATELYNAYISWKPKSVPNISQAKFGRHVHQNLKYKKTKDNYGCFEYLGLSLKNFILPC